MARRNEKPRRFPRWLSPRPACAIGSQITPPWCLSSRCRTSNRASPPWTSGVEALISRFVFRGALFPLVSGTSVSRLRRSPELISWGVLSSNDPCRPASHLVGGGIGGSAIVSGRRWGEESGLSVRR